MPRKMFPGRCGIGVSLHSRSRAERRGVFLPRAEWHGRDLLWVCAVEIPMWMPASAGVADPPAFAWRGARVRSHEWCGTALARQVGTEQVGRVGCVNLGTIGQRTRPADRHRTDGYQDSRQIDRQRSDRQQTDGHRTDVTMHRQACSSMAERCYHMAEVGGSIPSAPTIHIPSTSRRTGRGACTRHRPRLAVAAELSRWHSDCILPSERVI
jgi:hypothetical protein